MNPWAARVLFVDQTGKIGGAERGLYDLARRFCPPGAVALFEDGPFATLLTDAGVPVHPIGVSLPRIRLKTGLSSVVASTPALLRLVARLSSVARSYDVVVANTMKAVFASAAAGAILRIPVVVYLHDNIESAHFGSFNRRVLVSACNRFADVVVVNSRATGEAFVRSGGRPGLLRVVYNGFDIARYASPSVATAPALDRVKQRNASVISCFSRLSEIKGQHVLVEAVRRLSANVTLLLVGGALFGERDYERRLRAEVATLPKNIEVVFTDFVDDVVPWMHASDIVVAPSVIAEGFGRTIVEAQLCGRPIIATDAGPVREIVEDGVTGWLVPPGDASALAERLRWALQHPPECAAVARAGRQSAASKFDLNELFKSFERVLAEALERRSSRSLRHSAPWPAADDTEWRTPARSPTPYKRTR